MTSSNVLSSTKLSWRKAALAALLLVALGIIVLLLMGRPPICVCGAIKLWHGQTLSAENSQHIADWYTFTHVVHGLLFYFLLWLACRIGGRPFDVARMFVAAIAIETGWEILENTNFVIDRYRTTTADIGYYGDSVLNSFFDIVAMALGFLAAARLPVWVSIAAACVMEAGLALVIRDNLTLNIVMLLYPFETIRDWQQGIHR